MNHRPPLVVVGDVLLDRDIDGTAERLAPDAPAPVVDVADDRSRPGGAGLAAVLAAADGREVVLVTALGDDPASRTVRAALAPRVRLVELPLHGTLPEKIRIRADGRPLVRIDRGGGSPGEPDDAARAALRAAGAVLVADYGRGTATALRPYLAEAARRVPLVWDPHPRGDEPVPGARLATPNAAEARALAPGGADPGPGGALPTALQGNAVNGTEAGADGGDEPVPGARPATPDAAEARALAPGGAPGPGPDGRTAAAHRPRGDGTDGPDTGPDSADPAAGSTAGRETTGYTVTGHATTGRTATAPGGDSLRTHGLRGARLAERWRAATVAVTLGARGALLTRPGSDSPMLVPAPQTSGGDPCGAGDRFAAAAAAALADGALPEEAVQRAVAEAAGFVAAGGAGNPALWRGRPAAAHRPGGPDDPFALAESVRARGGTVVATGGCFDLLHAGHVGLLENARRVGDCLIVCVNSDDSVRRLKGPGRPLNHQADRVRVLAGLGCVDAVAVFDEDTPEELLRALRPDLWVKGGDYSVEALPEAPVLRGWGGQALVLPYLDGRSTTEIARRAALAPSSPGAAG
ncbi:D-glycero-beta-D-manno-heptose 1-phosphate adenylyltransferase [Streptomyces sp. F63]|uniref:D-glycero-beta-D-manno-heptose 1-phosphate adenylyltransferase n=1 Tax=Streptomyces sp. F63 TaxID=2824887 RepID=UPI001B364D46|nr:D-glycero-beta-D-manno-heptose 1-phosphate adenylyltransferase [Streptomyces sp. F63]MBQ0986934.1 D-glycero-beta-D-manno-heptose 1-phosphate adenylyltransferase [Streptomyces sp. F63]